MELVKIGKIIKTRGIKGEVKVYPYTEPYCMEHYCSLSFLWLGKDEKAAEKYKVVGSKIFQKYFLFIFDDVNNPEEAFPLVGKFIFVPQEQRAALEENEVFIEDLVGSEVFQLDGEKLGVVKNFFYNGVNGVCEVERVGSKDKNAPQKDFLFPTTKQILREVISEEKKLIIDPLEGMLE